MMPELFVLRDVLEADLAEEAHRFLTTAMPADWWYASSTPAAYAGARTDIRNTPDRQNEIKVALDAAQRAINGSTLAFFFFRTFAHAPECKCVICRVIACLSSSDMRRRISALTGEDLNSSVGFFCSRYDHGCFLGPHTDAKNGRVAVSLSLTKSWAADFGGLLHVMPEPDSDLGSVAVPNFNSIAGFTIPRDVGRLHFVSQVAPEVKRSRFTVSGWYR